MLEKFKAILYDKYNAFKGKAIYLAISGGKDSILLSNLLLKLEIPHTLLHCNFKLRGADADMDEAFLIAYAKKNKLSIKTKSFNTKEYAKTASLSIQEAARDLRYTWFNTFLIDSKTVLLTAHHQDDSIETFFINLMRGTGLKGLTGINDNEGSIYRPLTDFSSEDIANYIAENKIEFRQDKSNFDTKYLRNELRNNLIPQFEKRSVNFKTKVANTIDSLTEVDNWIEKKAEEFRAANLIQAKKGSTINKALISNEEDVFLMYVFKDYGIYRGNIASFKKVINSAIGAKFMTTTYAFTVDRSEIFIQKINAVNNAIVLQTIANFPKAIKVGETILNFSLIKEVKPFNKPNYQQLDVQKIKLPLTVRNWQKGDKIQPLGMKGSKLISDVLIDAKVPLIQKNEVLIIKDKTDRIIAVIGFLIADFVKVGGVTDGVVLVERVGK